jgi:hypothetical protein
VGAADLSSALAVSAPASHGVGAAGRCAAPRCGDGLAIRKQLAAGNPSNTNWQRDLWISDSRLADLAERQNQTDAAHDYWKNTVDVLSGIEERGLHLSPDDRRLLELLRQKVGGATPRPHG